MGCKQSKGIEYQHQRDLKGTPTSPLSASSWSNVSIPREILKITDPGQRLFELLSESKNDDLIWAQIMKLLEAAPSAVNYQDNVTLDTPLHLACRLISTTPPTNDALDATPIDAIRIMIRCSADASTLNKKGYIPLHDALYPIDRRIIRKENDVFTSIRNQAEVVNFLIASDYESSVQYLSRNDVVFPLSSSTASHNNTKDDGCTPLYHAVASLPDDFTAAPGPTVQLASTLHYPNTSMSCTKNASNYDKPLALLYRRFSRQFDLSEKFFPGDNSRKEVIDHRQKYKVAAMNTWKIILALIDPVGEKDRSSSQSQSEFYMVHSAVQKECPQDLLRYIIETRPEEVRQVNEYGRLPLHVAANAAPSSAESSYHYKFVIDELLYSYADGAASSDGGGKLPLQLAIESGKKWIGGGVKSLHDVFPDAMSRVKMEDYPSIKRALSFSTNFTEDKNSGVGSGGDLDEASFVKENGIVKEEHFDAIMMVQKPDADLGDIVSAMWANEEDGGVQMLGCVAITALANKHKHDVRMLRSIGMSAVNTIVNAMKNHPNEPAVQEKGCAALNVLSPSDNYREVSFAASGAVASIVASMQAHVSDAIVQIEACAALRNILKYGGSDRATVIASVSGFTAIKNALGAHPSVDAVQVEASSALEALSAFPDANLPDLGR